MKKSYFLLFILFFLISCGGLKEAGKVLRNEKVNTTDEFLVEKKEPLIMPPDLNKIPEPQSIKNNNQNEENKIKNILKMPSSSVNKKNSNTSTEDSIIDKINRW